MIRFAARLAALALVAASAACHATIDVPITSSTTVKGGTLFQNLLSQSFGDFTSIDLASSAEFKNAGIDKDDVESVRLSGLTLTVTAPAGGTLEFLDEVAFYVEAEGLPKVKVAEAAAVPDSATTLALTTTNVELAPYVTAPKLSLTTETKAHAPRSDTTLEARAVFTVDPRLF
jgi:hypothetical protein